MAKIDSFTRRRLEKFVNTFRDRKGQLPVGSDFASAGFDKPILDQAVKDKILGEFYVTLTSGAVVKGYKVLTD